MVEGLGIVRLRALLEHFETTNAVLKANKKDLMSIQGIGDVISDGIINISKSGILDKELNLIKKKKVKIITVYDKDYPQNLKSVFDPPILIYVQGDLDKRDILSIAIVGSRRPSFYGRATAERLGKELSSLGITIVSGMARGIDTAGHKGATRNGGRTIAVLGSGLGVIYPPENKELFEEIASKGAVVSEFPMGTIPDRKNFPKRNRIISGLSLGVIVVEAARHSGSLITADLALEQGREVFAVPGNAGAINSQGTNHLIKEGAKLVENSADVLEELGPILRQYIPGSGSKDGNQNTDPMMFPKMDKTQSQIFSVLSQEPAHIDEITDRCKLTAQAVSSSLVVLELKGLIRQLPGKMFVKVLY
ncbi:MAG: DNA-protecting protein DprA [Candidatus Omnitrophica bacterium]|nr:DNA-protecting protein DprA [Candidatus Omnitrophota bacterium]